MASSEPTTPEPERMPRRPLNPKWVFAVIAVLISSLLAGPLWQIAQRRPAIHAIRHYSGSVRSLAPRGPQWLREWISDDLLEYVDQPDCVEFVSDEVTHRRRNRLFGGTWRYASGPTIDDDSLKCVLELPNLKKLDLQFTNVGDEGMKHVCRLQYLEELNLMGTDVSDLSIPILSQKQSLKRIVIRDTQITVEGACEIAAAFPGCEVQGPHNNRFARQIQRKQAALSFE